MSTIVMHTHQLVTSLANLLGPSFSFIVTLPSVRIQVDSFCWQSIKINCQTKVFKLLLLLPWLSGSCLSPVDYCTILFPGSWVKASLAKTLAALKTKKKNFSLDAW